MTYDDEVMDALENFVASALDSDTWKGNDDDVFTLVKSAVERFGARLGGRD